MAEKDIQAVLTEVIRRANETVRRLRSLEEREIITQQLIDEAVESLTICG